MHYKKMDLKIFMKLYIIMIMFLGISMGVKATEYVFKTTDSKYICIDSNGNLNATETFDHTTCIWSGTSGSGTFKCNNKAFGTLSGNINVNILGGTVGGTVNGSTYNANVHGGGYGASTIFTGNVDVTIGGSAIVNGSVYGGSALGKTNNAYTASSKTKTTNVTMTGGTINGSLFGAGLGSTAAVITNPVVTMSGGTVTQNVFGGGDAAKVDGNTNVKITGPSHVGNNVYGGGNAAEVTGITNVQIGEKKE